MYKKLSLQSALLTHGILIVGALTMLMPFIWMVMTSFKTLPEVLHVPIVWIPEKLTFASYITAWHKLNFLRYTLNTVIVTVSLTIGQLFLCSLAAYSFARLRFPGRDVIFFVLLSVLMVPAQMTMIPKYMLMIRLDWLDTYRGLIIPNLPSVYGTFILRQFFKSIPTELENAAKIDGCSYFRLYWNIFLPLAQNALIAFGIFVVIWAWNDFLWPLIVTTSDELRVLPVGIATLLGSFYSHEYNLIMAASVLATLPLIIVFIVGQKHVIAGISVSGIKG